MDSSDVSGGENAATRGCTVHVFEASIGPLGVTPGRLVVESSSAARIAASGWPPDALFHYIYAALVMKTFGASGAATQAKKVWKDQLPSASVMTSREYQEHASVTHAAAKMAYATKSADNRQQRIESRDGNRTFDSANELALGSDDDDRDNSGEGCSQEPTWDDLDMYDKVYFARQRQIFPEVLDAMAMRAEEEEEAARMKSKAKVRGWIE
jgi:hypothetical protein